MSWQTDTISPCAVHSAWRWRRIGVALLIGHAVIIAACGTSTGGGSQPTPTPQPSPTATPIPCTGWRTVASPTNSATYPNSSLSAVSVLSPSAAWAVGVNYSEGGTTTQVDSLIGQWDGSAWHLVANSGHDALYGITAISPRDIWAVGGQLNYGAGAGTLTMHWNGTAWSVVPSAQPADARYVALQSVAALGANDVWAVGFQDAGPVSQNLPTGRLQPLIEHWDGSAWHLVTSPMPQGAIAGTLSAVTRIPGTNQLWAVGYWSKLWEPAQPQPLLEQWNGVTWQIVTGPPLPHGARGGTWDGLVAPSATDAWVVGAYYITAPVAVHPLTGHWDGTSWTTVPSPDTLGILKSVAAAGTQDVRVVGQAFPSAGGHTHLLIEQWNGATWQIATSPEPSGATYSELEGIATDGAGNYWAVGSYLTQPTANQYQTLPLTLHCP